MLSKAATDAAGYSKLRAFSRIPWNRTFILSHRSCASIGGGGVTRGCACGGGCGCGCTCCGIRGIWKLDMEGAGFGVGKGACCGVGAFTGPAVEGPAEVSSGDMTGGGVLDDSLPSLDARFRARACCCSACSFLPRFVKGRLARPISCECSDMSTDIVRA